MPINPASDNATKPQRNSLVEEGITLARKGDRAGARTALRRVIHRDPYCEDAWLWLAWVAEDKAESLRYLEEAQRLLPESQRLLEALRWARRDTQPSAVPTTPAGPKKPAAAIGARPAASGPRTPSSAPRTKRVSERARTGASSAPGQVATGATRAREAVRAASTHPAFWHYLVPALSALATMAILAFVFMGLSRARQHSSVVRALELPTVAVSATSTPTIQQRTAPLWVQVDVAWTRADWDAATRALEQIRVIDPRNDEARKKLAEAYYEQGCKLIKANRLDDAGATLDRAIRVDASNERLQEVRRQLKMYLNGLDSYWAQDWQRVVDNLKVVHKVNPNFRDTHVMLGQAYYQLGILKQDAQIWDEARDSFVASLEFLPDSQDARKRLAVVQDVILPPRRIEASLSKQTVTLYENHKPVKIFVMCSGKPSTPTVAGRYQILDKIPMAYASKWGLDMPWWLGIYWAGGSEDGFHALPILSNGRVLWAGYLGRPCSYGCMVLDTPDAKFMYDWAEIGMTVFVNP